MLASSLSGRGAYVQCKHVYHILQMIMFYGFMEDFIHYYITIGYVSNQLYFSHSSSLL
jgi:hypothetical protein